MSLREKVVESIEILQLASEMSLKYYKKPLVVTYSGGKDSDVLLHLAIRSGIPMTVINSHTTVDAPQTVYHIRKKFAKLKDSGIDTKIIMPKMTMWKLIASKSMPPTRLARYCCEYLKETTTPESFVATGVRADESQQRSSRQAFESLGSRKDNKIGKTFHDMREVFREAEMVQAELGQTDNELNGYDCKFIEKAKQQNDSITNPIISWTERDVWEYIYKNGIETNELYCMGYRRVGCVGCPMGGRKSQLKEFADFPTYKRAYIRAFDKMIENHKGHIRTWKNGRECFEWWTESPVIPGQITIDEWIKDRGISDVD